MMQYITKYIKLCAWGLIAWATLSHVQAEAQVPNMVPNGDFATSNPSEASLPLDWHARQGQLVYLKNASDPRPRSKDRNMISFDGRFWLQSKRGQDVALIDVIAGQDYSLIFWHKGTNGGARLQAIIGMYDANGDRIDYKNRVLSSGWTEAGEWKLSKVQLKWSNASGEDFLLRSGTVQISLDLRLASGTDHVYLDDVAIVPVGREAELDADDPSVFLVPPARLNEPRVHQREVELSWEQSFPDGDDGSESFSWELTVGDRQPVLLSSPSYIITHLEPGSTYQIRLRTLYKGGRSGQVFREVSTSLLQFSQEDPLRVPYLRLISRDGYAPQTLPLYFNELAKGNALCRYWINGQEVSPEGNVLHFPSRGTHKLKVYVREDDDHEWTLDYNQLIVN